MISLIHPSRGRPRKAFEAATTWINKSGVEEIEYILSIDESEPFAPEYQRLFEGMTYIVRPNRNAVEAINEAAKLTTGDIIVVMSDDFDCPKNWGQIIEKTTRHKKDFLLKVHDGTQNWIVTLPIMDREYYNRLGHIYHPNFKHMFCDTWMTHQADATGKLIVRNEVVFRHNHYSVIKSAKDEVSKKADSTWAGGKAAYLWLVRQNFMHLPDYGISELGKSHISWLKQAL